MQRLKDLQFGLHQAEAMSPFCDAVRLYNLSLQNQKDVVLSTVSLSGPPRPTLVTDDRRGSSLAM